MCLFCCCEKVFTHINTWITGKNLTKHYYLKKKDFYSHLNTEDITDADYTSAKRVCKGFKIENVCSKRYIFVS